MTEADHAMTREGGLFQVHGGAKRNQGGRWKRSTREFYLQVQQHRSMMVVGKKEKGLNRGQGLSQGENEGV